MIGLPVAIKTDMVFQKFQFTNYMYTRTDGIALNEQILLVPGVGWGGSKSKCIEMLKNKVGADVLVKNSRYV